jgi:hypothetical protein
VSTLARKIEVLHRHCAEVGRDPAEVDITWTIVVETDPPHGFKGPVMSPAPTGRPALELWDAIEVVSQQPGFFELARPRTAPPRPPALA